MGILIGPIGVRAAPAIPDCESNRYDSDCN